MVVNKDRKVFSTQNSKIRQIFSTQKFRGLDKENKPLKVAPFRASDGHNFIIDSDVLKTRPAFKINQQIPFSLNTDEFIVDFYNFRNTDIYITNSRLFFGSTEIFSAGDNKDFSNSNPMFFEEKEVLFIFGLDTIYVASQISNTRIFYPLNNKITNPGFQVDTTHFKDFEDLPTPYVPTLFIGNNFFEDVNLLSNKTKYKIFAENTSNGFFVREGGLTTYRLPTAYSFEKNGTYEAKVRFYKKAYADNEFFPVFIDDLYQYMDADWESLGTPLNDTITPEGDDYIPIQIEGTYFVKKDLEEVSDGTVFQESIVDIGITKKEFFNLFVKDLKVTVFEYCMDIAKTITATENVTLLFSLPVDYNLIRRDENGNVVFSGRQSETRNLLVYFLKYDSQTFDVINLQHAFNEITIPFNSGGQFPSYPTLTGHTYIAQVLTVDGGTLYLNDTTEVIQVALSAARRAVVEIRNTLTTLDKIRVNLQYVVVDPEDFPPVRKTLYSISVGVQYTEAEILTKDNLHEISFNSRDNMFELSLRDFFIDFRNEPSVDVEITFQNNPDYDLITQNKFSVLFGSENRLFLAGHPDFPNIDRFNVSNDLLGNNVKNQSYELSYFPSKNFRVVGGKGAINGYVVATDTALYVSKEEYPGDNKMFVRTRSLSEEGIVGYFEFKTSITKTPLNHRCFVRFYNDIIMLSKDGLYAVELTDNILTSERLLKLRSGFINTDLKQAIANYDNKKIFIAENNYYMYIFIDDVVYVADSRYIDTNENASIGNVSYEIVKWNMNTSYKLAKLTETTSFLLDDTYSQIYTLVLNENNDDNIERTINVVSKTTVGSGTYFITLESYDQEILLHKKDVQFIFPSGFQFFSSNTHYSVQDTVLTVINNDIFRDITDGDTIHYGSNNELSFVVSDFESSNRTTMTVPVGVNGILTRSIANIPLYIVEIFEDNNVYYKLDRYQPEVIIETSVSNNTPTYEFYSIPDLCNINYRYPIDMMFLSNVTDFGNNFMEKTMYRVNLYATRQQQENTLNFGYKTMRRLKNEEDTEAFNVLNNLNFNEIDFNLFSINTFQESGLSLPMKENNFLYIQFIIKAIGNVELNGFHVVYKNNRNIKSVG